MSATYHLARLTHNTENWMKPSGPEHKSGNISSENPAFEALHDFGFEEWLFNAAYEFNDYQYGYVEGINHVKEDRRKNLEECPLLLYTLKYKANRKGPSERLLVAVLNEWKYAILPEKVVVNKWRDAMIADLSNVLNGSKLENAINQVQRHANQHDGKPLKNIMFKSEHVKYCYRNPKDISGITTYGRFNIISKNANDILLNGMQACE